MTGFDLLQNFTTNPELLLRRVCLSCLLRSHSRQPNQSTKHRQLLKLWPRRCFAITLLLLLTLFPRGLRLTPVERISKSRWFLPRWCMPTLSVTRPMRMLVPISNSSWSFVVLLLSQDAIRLRLFPFSLLGRAKQWFYTNKTGVDTWDKCAKVFLTKFFSTRKTNALRGVSCKHLISQFLRPGRDFRSTSLRVRTTGWTIGLFFKTATMGWLKYPVIM